MLKVFLTRDQIAYIDDIDSDLLQYNWTAIYQKHYQKDPKFVAGRQRFNKLVLMHKVILERKLGRSLIKGEKVDHIDRNPLNNCRNNLRLSTNGQNRANSPVNKNTKTGLKGVYIHRSGRYYSAIQKDGKLYWLGYFNSKEEAHEAYKQAAQEKHGDFANY